MNLAVAGTGYVGLVAGVCFAQVGHNVTCVDVDERKVALMQSGVSPIYEADLEDLMCKNFAAGRLHYTTAMLPPTGTLTPSLSVSALPSAPTARLI